MECLKNPVWNELTKEELEHLHIEAPDEEVRKKIMQNWDMIAKPLDGLGRFESIIARIGAILGTEEVDIPKKAVVIMCADNGIVEEGISQSGQEVTAIVAQNMARKQSSVGKMATVIGADTIPVDIGINQQEEIEGLVNRKIRCGTRNFYKEPAMTESEMLKAIHVGIDMVEDCKKKGYQIVATGEMGIGNTTTSSAVTAALLGCKVEEVTGRGAGLSDEGLLRKQKIIAEAIDRYQLKDADAFRILATVGGLDIAGLTGICIGGAQFHMPIVLDGVISMVAALLAERIVPGVKEYCIPSHKGKEPAMEQLIRTLALEPVIDGSLALGEGTGAVMMLSLLDLAFSVYRESTTFSDIRIEQYRRYCNCSV